MVSSIVHRVETRLERFQDRVGGEELQTVIVDSVFRERRDEREMGWLLERQVGSRVRFFLFFRNGKA